MQKLSRDDLFSLEQYAESRPAFRDKVLAHKRDRRLALGTNAALYFEDRLTMQYQVQEMLRIERIFEADGINEELDAYNPLIPDGSNWKATFMVEFAEAEERRAMLTQLVGIEDRVYVQVADFDRVFAIADEDLELAAGLAGYEVEVGDGEVLFKAGLPLAAAGTELQTLLSSEHEPNSTATDGLDPDRLNQADLDELRERFVGTSLPVKATLAGLDRVRLSGAAELSSSPDPAQLQATDYTGELTDGDTTTLAVGENKGKSTYEFITVRRLAADGSPLLP